MTILINRPSPPCFDHGGRRVKELVIQKPLSIRANATIREAIDSLSKKEMRSAPVVNDAGRSIGVFRLSDLVRSIREYGIVEQAFFDMRVEELMTPLEATEVALASSRLSRL